MAEKIFGQIKTIPGCVYLVYLEQSNTAHVESRDGSREKIGGKSEWQA